MKIFHFSQQGHRHTQQDAYFADSADGKTFIVCDGVGGAPFGEIASRTVADYMMEATKAIADVSWSDETITGLYRGAHRRMIEVMEEDAWKRGGMATTAVMVNFTPSEMIISHIGDSRAYIVWMEEVRYWHTKDHSMVQELYDAGVIKTEAAMRVHPMKNRINRALIALPGEAAEPSIERFAHPAAGDIIMLCTDGVLEAFPEDEFLAILMDPSLTLEEKGREIQEECGRGSRDNNTSILIEIGGV